jgi:hypothetical protein
LASHCTESTKRHTDALWKEKTPKQHHQDRNKDSPVCWTIWRKDEEYAMKDNTRRMAASKNRQLS